MGVKAQGTGGAAMGIIIGNVLDAESNKAVVSITVTLKGKTDSSYSRSIVTDKSGAFDFDRIPFGFYQLQFSGVGYAPLSIDSIHIRAERFDFNLGDVKLSQKATDLSEVIVYAEKPLIESREGKITFNVGESALSAGSNTSELLKNMPLVSNDANGNILLKGKEPKILIDDKPTELNAQQLADLLESLPGSSIEKIEVMTTPPPQYASETGGVINIITKKGKIGLTGRIILSYGSRGDANLAANVSYRYNKWSANLSAGTGANQFKGEGYSYRSNIYKDSTSYLNTRNHSLNRSLRPNARLSVDYEINKRNLLNLTAQISGNFFKNESFTTYQNLNNEKTSYRISNRQNKSHGGNFYPSFSLNYTWKGRNARETFRVFSNYNIGRSEINRNYFQQFLQGNGDPTGIDSTQQQEALDKNHTYGLRIQYEKPTKPRTSMLSFGSAIYRDNFHNVLNTHFLKKPEQVFVQNMLLSNDFNFMQTIASMRAGITIDLSKQWRLTTSIQEEMTEIDFDFRNNNPDTSNRYWNTLPNISLRKEWKKEWNASFTYRKSVRRPGIGELNPSINYNDPYNLRFGNPLLSPQLADNFDLNFGTYRGKFYGNISVGYNKVKDIIQSIRTLIPDGKTQITFQNITDRKEYEASLWGGYTFSRQLRVNVSGGYTYNQYSEYDRTKNKYRNGSSFYTGLNYNFILTDRISFDGNLRYSAYADPQGRSRSNLSQNIGVQTKYFNKRVILSLNLIDLFAQQQFNSYTYGSNFTLQSVNSTNSRNIRLAVSYNLNKNRSSLSNKQRKQILEKVKLKSEGK
jgi:ferric enterobactin receptor